MAPHYAEVFALDKDVAYLVELRRRYDRDMGLTEKWAAEGRFFNEYVQAHLVDLLCKEMLREYARYAGTRHSDVAEAIQRIDGNFGVLNHAYLQLNFMKSPVILKLDEALAESLEMQGGAGKLPCSLLDSLPFECFFVDCGNDEGFFFVRDGEEWHVTLLWQDSGEPPFARVLCSGSFVNAGTTRMTFDDAAASSLERYGEGFLDWICMDEQQYFGNFEFVASVLAYLCSVTADMTVEYEPAKRSGEQKSNPKKKRTSEATYIKVGATIGAQLARSSSKASSLGLSINGKTVSPHIRRAHWHRFWCGAHGSDERRLEVRWIPPTMVGGERPSLTMRKVV